MCPNQKVKTTTCGTSLQGYIRPEKCSEKHIVSSVLGWWRLTWSFPCETEGLISLRLNSRMFKRIRLWNANHIDAIWRTKTGPILNVRKVDLFVPGSRALLGSSRQSIAGSLQSTVSAALPVSIPTGSSARGIPQSCSCTRLCRRSSCWTSCQRHAPSDQLLAQSVCAGSVHDCFLSPIDAQEGMVGSVQWLGCFGRVWNRFPIH
jgi:hypothetical protein